MKTKYLLFTVLLGFDNFTFATTNKISEIDISILNAQKVYLSTVNQCANPLLYNKVIDNALNAKDHKKRTFFAAQIEETIIKNPACFVSAITKMGYKKCEALEENFLKEPYFYPKNEIYRSLGLASNFGGSCFSG